MSYGMNMNDAPRRDRWYVQDIEITDEHRKLAAHAAVGFQDDVEWGAVELDAKRPFGNSDMPGDVAEILGWEVEDGELSDEQIDRARQLHFEMGYVIKTLLRMFAESAVSE